MEENIISELTIDQALEIISETDLNDLVEASLREILGE